ncbi:MAG: phenylalanine--tRNA ligase subunit alpha [Candidatus Thermoplasmatota archaeon]|nr:phenylalanine--tRNA ligase subunit alpha [Candidatus Thermoplasmatota archaeon]
MVELSTNERKVLTALKHRKLSIEQLQALAQLDKTEVVMSALSWLKLKNLVSLEEKIKVFYSLDIEGKEYAEDHLPENKILSLLKEGDAELKVIFESLGKDKARIGIGYLKELGAQVIGNKLRIEPNIFNLVRETISEREKFIKELSGKEKEEKELEPKILEHFKARKNILKKRIKVLREARLTVHGKKLVDKISVEEVITQLTPQLIRTGEWQKRILAKYDINTFVASAGYAKLHPLTKIITQIKKIFFEMGFKEIEFNYLQPCFWNMDALFIPQDHPARDVQDSFYTDRIAKIDSKLAAKIKVVHEKAWQYKWDLKEAEKIVLRTHTTTNTIKYLAEHSKEEQLKVFSIGRNFRREAIDATHLPEFTQIEGICMEEGTNLAMLLGILKEFYSKLGFENISFRPSYFPFTEPSLEVIIEFEDELLEMGGAGIFRNEVTKTLGVKYPVLAWGLGLERLAMLKLGLKDIRNFYLSDLEWLRNARIK